MTKLRTEADAKVFLESVRGFHDGFIRSIQLRSYDEFEIRGDQPEDIGHIMKGHFDATIEFEHHPGVEGGPPKRRVSKMTFSNVTEFRVELQDLKATEWAIFDVTIVESLSSNHLELWIEMERYSTEKEWVTHKERWFCFNEACVEP